MTNIDIANGLLFQALGVNIDTFDNRLLCQKKIYLLQELGVDMGYTYNWYVHGPYSPDLTAYLFRNLDVLKELDFSKYAFSVSVQEKIDIVNSFINEKPYSLSVPSWYELLASVLYIHKRWNNENEIETLKQFKPQFEYQQVETAVNALKASGCYS